MTLAVGDLPDVAEVVEDTQHCPQKRCGDGLSTIWPEGVGAGEHDVVGERILDRRDVPDFDGALERVHGVAHFSGSSSWRLPGR
jgi:hypothetical protein